LLISIFTKLALDIDLFIDVAIGGWVKLAESTVEEIEMSQLTQTLRKEITDMDSLPPPVLSPRHSITSRRSARSATATGGPTWFVTNSPELYTQFSPVLFPGGGDMNVLPQTISPPPRAARVPETADQDKRRELAQPIGFAGEP
jgi:hypothetical protein